MTKNLYIPLKERSVLEITGNDKRQFLQGLLSNNLDNLSPEHALYALLLTPQGKYLADFFIAENGDSFLCDIPSEQKSDIIKRLKMYKLRSDVTITDRDDMYESVALIGPNVFEHITQGQKTRPFCKGVVYLDPRSDHLFARAFIETENRYQSFIVHDFSEGKNHDYNRLRLEYTIPDQQDLTSGDSFPLEFSLDKLNAIDYNKGCYVGQEVTARSHHRGTLKKTLYQVKSNSDTDLPKFGETLHDHNNNKLGIMLSSYESTGLALLRKKEVDESHHQASYNNTQIEIIPQ